MLGSINRFVSKFHVSVFPAMHRSGLWVFFQEGVASFVPMIVESIEDVQEKIKGIDWTGAPIDQFGADSLATVTPKHYNLKCADD